MSPALHPPVGPDDHCDGLESAPLTLVEYGDFECPYCGMAYPIVKNVQRALGDEMRFVFRHFPLKESHPHALHSAEAAEAAAAAQRFWDMHDMLFEHQSALDDLDLVQYAQDIGIDPVAVAQALAEGTYAGVVREYFRSGVKSGVNGTPTFFVNGVRFDGDWRNERELIAALRAGANSAVMPI